MTVVLLGFGSSARRGHRPWTDRARVRLVLDTCRPDIVVDGASPAGGADDLVHGEAVALGLRAVSCHVDTAIDGPWPRAGVRRNERMFREHRPTVAAGFVSGRVGEPMSSGSAHMASICLRGLGDALACPVVVYREDGIQPAAHPLGALRLLYARTKAPELVPAGLALRALREGKASREEVLAALGCAREGSRWAPWIEAVERAVIRAA